MSFHTNIWYMGGSAPCSEDFHEEQWVAQRLGYGGPNTLFYLLLCCFSFVALYCVAWTASICPWYFSVYYKFSANPKLNKHHEHVGKRQIASRKWHPINGVFFLVLGVKQPSLVSLQTRGDQFLLDIFCHTVTSHAKGSFCKLTSGRCWHPHE